MKRKTGTVKQYLKNNFVSVIVNFSKLTGFVLIESSIKHFYNYIRNIEKT